MVRNAKRRLGARAYANYTPEKLQECLNKIKSKEMAQREASEAYGIPRSTIKNKLKGSHPNKTGRPRVFTDKEEQSFEDHLIELCDSSSSEDEDVEVFLESDGLSETFSDLEEVIQDPTDCHLNPAGSVDPSKCAVDNFIVVNYNGQMYPGRIISLSRSGPTVECMEKKLKFWRWPEKKDIFSYDWEDVCYKIEPPKMASKRIQFFVPELDVFYT